MRAATWANGGLAARHLIAGVPFVRLGEAAATNYPNKNVLEPSFAPIVFLVGDFVAGLLYPGYSFTAQAPSELFAVGAPTSCLVVQLFSLSSALFVAFSFGVWRASGGRRNVHVVALLIAANGIDSLVLWQLPMHMRGVPPTFSDRMHLILAVNPFVLLSIGFGAAAFRNWFGPIPSLLSSCSSCWQR